MSSPRLTAGLIASLSGFFLSDIPVLLSSTGSDGPQLVKHWTHLYNLGSQLYPAVAIGISLFYVFAALGGTGKGRGFVFFAAAAVTMGMAPYTWMVMSPTNSSLFRIDELGAAGTTTPMDDILALIIRWRWLHFARSFFPLTGALLGLRESVFR
ncbi:hypothetical protein GGS20DRAFT_589487 [Poronia punctata]|nr:hypothetical protein GGS20DRAFT_589487 [Poronia punctata]